MFFEEYQELPEFLDYIRVAHTTIQLGANDYELTLENKSFFDNKIILVPFIEGVKMSFMINMAFEPYTELFDFTLIETNIYRGITTYYAFKITLKD